MFFMFLLKFRLIEENGSLVKYALITVGTVHYIASEINSVTFSVFNL